MLKGIQVLSVLVCITICTVGVNAQYVYIGSSSSTPGGIQTYKQESNGTLTPVFLYPMNTPWFLAIHPNGKVMYVAGNQVYVSLNILPNGQLTFLNSQPCGGQGPTHVSVHRSGNYLFGANYDDGTFVSFPLSQSGQILQRADLKKPGTAAWTVADRQEGPHAHMITPVPYNDSQIVGMDLGADKMFVFALDQASGRLNQNGVPYGQVASGAGCRHIAFHPTKFFAYVLAEMGNTVYVYAYDPKRGSLNNIQAITMLPSDYNGDFTKAAEIRVHANGQFVYATNRGHNSIVCYRVNATSGMLTTVGWTPSQGNSPRGMNIDPNGKYLYVANEEGNVVGFSINPTTGALSAVGVVKTPNAVDVEFALFSQMHTLKA